MNSRLPSKWAKNRRVSAVAAAIATAAVGLVGATSLTPNSGAASSIVEANKPGTQIPAVDSATLKQIEGYADAQSVNVGSSVGLHLSSKLGAVDVHVYRLGWYGGLGAREVTVLKSVGAAAQAIPAPNADGRVEANWPTSTNLAVGADWTSGLYALGLNKAGATAPSAFVPLIVRDDASTSPFLYVAATNTYQAYNNWGGKSLYTFNSTNSVAANKVSFDRPYEGENGAGMMFEGDHFTAQFLEKEGYNVAYAASSDLETNPSLLNNHKAFLTSYHDEYWTAGMRTNLENSVTAGKHAAFFGANSMFWQVRYEPNSAGVAGRTMVGYRANAAADPVTGPTRTGAFRDNGRPENAFLGSMYESDFAYGNSAPWVVSNAAHWIYNGTGLANGDQIQKMVGYEWDRIWANGATPAGVIALSNSVPQAGALQQATIYQKGSALVFNGSTIYWPWLLTNGGWGTDARVQQMTRNLLNAMLDPNGPPATTTPPTTVAPPTTIPASTTTTIPAAGVVQTWNFEDGTTQGWGNWYGTGVMTQTATGGHSGPGAARSTVGPYSTGLTGVQGLTAGATYTVTGFVKNDSPTFNLAVVQFYNAGTAISSVDAVFTPDANGWSKFSSTFVVPASTTVTYIGVNGGESPMLLDDVTLSGGPGAPTTTVPPTTAPPTTVVVVTTAPPTTVPPTTAPPTTVPPTTVPPTTTVAPTTVPPTTVPPTTVAPTTVAPTTTRPPTTTSTTTPPTTTTTTTTIPKASFQKTWDFENLQAPGWSSSNWLFGLGASTTSHTGRYSLKASTGSAILTVSQVAPAAKSYTFTAWVRPTSFGSVSGEAVLTQGLFGPTTRTPVTVEATVNGWQKVSVRFSNQATKVQFSANGGSFVIDDAVLEAF